MSINQIIEVKFKDQISGRLTIKSKVPSFLEEKLKSTKPVKLQNMTLINISKDEKIDNYSPIQYCNLPTYNSNIFLLEETDYVLTFAIDKKYINEDLKVFNYLKNHKDSKSKFYFNHVNDVWIANINFRSYAGKAFIDIKYKDFEFKLPVEVRSKKLNYDTEYSDMIANLAEYASGLMFSVNASLYQNHIQSKKESINTLYEYFMLLEYLFRPQNLPSVCEYISRNLYKLLENTTELVPTTHASNIGAGEIAELCCNPQHIIETTQKYSIYENNRQHYAPLMINEKKYIETIDTPENRFFKYFLEFIRDLICDLYSDKDKNKDKDRNQVKDSLEKYYNIINSILSQRYFNEISRLEQIPLNSQVLQKKEGYREILKYYLLFEFGLQISFNDLTDKFRGFEKEINQIYEIWSYFQLIEIVDELTGTKRDFERFVDKDKWAISMNHVKEIKDLNPIKIKEKLINITLMFKQEFKPLKTYKNGNYTIYSEKLDPDYTIKLEHNGITKFMQFDAKYRLKNGTYIKDDIYKMHTYKDAINDTLGAFILYPGENEPTKHYETDGDFGAVGAFCLKPGTTEHNKNEIKEFILEFIEDWLEYLKAKKINHG